MKLVLVLLFLLMTSILSSSFAFVNPVLAQTSQSDFTAHSGVPIPDKAINGTIGSEWNDTQLYTKVFISPYGIADVWLKHDAAYLYLALEFYADSNSPWVAIQFGPTFCMSTNADGALFGNHDYDNYSTNGYVDIYFGENAAVIPDTIQNGVGSITVGASNLTVVELKKPLDSGDVAGKDINWTVDGTYTFIIEWNSKGMGSNGGTITHYSASPIVKTVFIAPTPIPEFPAMPTLIGLAIVSVPATLAAKKRKIVKGTKSECK